MLAFNTLIKKDNVVTFAGRSLENPLMIGSMNEACDPITLKTKHNSSSGTAIITIANERCNKKVQVCRRKNHEFVKYKVFIT